MVAVEEAVGKVRAAVRARQDLDSDVLLIVRTDALGVARGSLDDAIARANAYLGAGADVVSVEAPATVDEIERVARGVRGPVMYNQSGDGPRLTTEQLARLGIAMVILPGAMLRPAMHEMYRHAQDLRNRGTLADVELAQSTAAHPLANLHQFSGMDQIGAWEQEFLPGETTGQYPGSQGYQPPPPQAP